MVEPTHLKNISQIRSFPQVGMNIKKYLKPPPSISIDSIDLLKIQYSFHGARIIAQREREGFATLRSEFTRKGRDHHFREYKQELM